MKTYFSSQTHYINTKRSQVHLGTYLHVTIIITFFSLSYDDNLNCLSLNLCIMLHLGSFPIEVLLTFDIYRIIFHNLIGLYHHILNKIMVLLSGNWF